MTFPAYPDYRDSGVEWLGVVPEHWGVKPLRYLGRFRKGLTITKADLTDTGIPCLNYGEVHSLYPFEVNQDIQPLKSVPAEYLETDPSACVKYGDFVFADTSEDLDGVGNFTHVSGMEPLFAGYHTIIYSLNSEVSSRFLAYCLESFAFRTQLRMGVKGVKVFSVTQEILRGGIAWLPTTAEQTQVARFLDHETARIDALIKEQQRLIELLKEKRQAVISHAVTKGLDPNVPLQDSGVEWLGEVPCSWRVIKFGITHDKAELGGNYEAGESEEGLPLIKMGNIGRGKIKLDKVEYVSLTQDIDNGHTLKEGDFLFNTRNSLDLVGKVCVWRRELQAALYNSNILRISFNKSLIGSSGFVNYLLNSNLGLEQLRLIARGTTSVAAIYYKDLSSLSFAFPLPSEQLEIERFLDIQTSQLDALVNAAEQAIDLIKERRSALISAAVTGKIDVRGWQLPVSSLTPELVQEAV